MHELKLIEGDYGYTMHRNEHDGAVRFGDIPAEAVERARVAADFPSAEIVEKPFVKQGTPGVSSMESPSGYTAHLQHPLQWLYLQNAKRECATRHPLRRHRRGDILKIGCLRADVSADKTKFCLIDRLSKPIPSPRPRNGALSPVHPHRPSGWEVGRPSGAPGAGTVVAARWVTHRLVARPDGPSGAHRWPG